jgi:beta-glucuronidase
MRFSYSLDGEWLFQIMPVSSDTKEEESWQSPDFKPDNWRRVIVPGNWDTYLPELFGYLGTGWYRKFFYVKPEWKRIILNFEGANYRTKVWINGEKVGENEGGFNNFQFEITNVVKWGKKNLIAVSVDNKPAIGRIPNSFAGWWNYGGIHRSVSLKILPKLFISDVFICSQPLDKKNASVDLEIELKNEEDRKYEFELIAEVELSEKKVSSMGEKAFLSSGEGKKIFLKTNLKNPQLWSLEKPVLYKLNLFISEKGKIIDELKIPFGVRKVEIKGFKFLLNGKPVFLKGINRHEEYYGTGRVDKKNILKYDMELIKEMGANIVRIHYPFEKRFYELADEMGLLTFAEIPYWQVGVKDIKEFTSPEVMENAKKQLENLVRELKNHPSVVIYSVGNECASEKEEGRSAIKELIDYTKKLDPTRPVTYASRSKTSCKSYDLVDFISENLYFDMDNEGLNKILDEIHALQPEKPILITEFGCDAIKGISGNTRGSEKYQAEVIKKNWEVFLSKKYIIGAILWCWADYWHQPMRTDLNLRWLNNLSHFYFCLGLLNLKREPKRAFFELKKLFKKGSSGNCVKDIGD